MKMTLYPLMRSPKGNIPSEFEVAEVTLRGGETTIHCHDGALREKIAQIFNTPLSVRRLDGDIPRLFAHHFSDVSPHTEEFFREIVHSLRHYNLFGIIEGRDAKSFLGGNKYGQHL
jgi:hypothetical protein